MISAVLGTITLSCDNAFLKGNAVFCNISLNSLKWSPGCKSAEG